MTSTLRVKTVQEWVAILADYCGVNCTRLHFRTITRDIHFVESDDLIIVILLLMHNAYVYCNIA